MERYKYTYKVNEAGTITTCENDEEAMQLGRELASHFDKKDGWISVKVLGDKGKETTVGWVLPLDNEQEKHNNKKR
jgi:hypothetical protein